MKFQPCDRIVFVKHFPFSDHCPISGVSSVYDLKGTSGTVVEEFRGHFKIKLDFIGFVNNSINVYAQEVGAIELEEVYNSPLMKALR